MKLKRDPFSGQPVPNDRTVYLATVRLFVHHTLGGRGFVGGWVVSDDGELTNVKTLTGNQARKVSGPMGAKGNIFDFEMNENLAIKNGWDR